jgi:hypothetical protein
MTTDSFTDDHILYIIQENPGCKSRLILNTLVKIYDHFNRSTLDRHLTILWKKDHKIVRWLDDQMCAHWWIADENKEYYAKMWVERGSVKLSAARPLLDRLSKVGS